MLGYIFEKYINQKQMGAYYTKEDITGYICKYTILPFLLDKVGLNVAQALADVEPYIYEAVKTEEYLPTETEREYAARRKRYAQIHADFAHGKITTVNDLITYNLDIQAFAEDYLRSGDLTATPTMLRGFYNALRALTVLDPTCGSGAFLFAAMNILEPLYEHCLDKMEQVVSGKDAFHYKDFRDELARVGQHPNRKYFVFKSIIVNNLYGVDIMDEAVEICKLRLFLKLVAQVDDAARIEPLPDIDFNIRAGNTLVGFATKEEIASPPGGGYRLYSVDEVLNKVAAADKALKTFREAQTTLSVKAADFRRAKTRLQAELAALRDDLDAALMQDYGQSDLAAFRRSHKPFHWYAEFNGVMSSSGFDVIVGNPPYVEYSKVRKEYEILGYLTHNCGNIYAFTVERCLVLRSSRGRIGMIVPLSLVSTERMAPLQQLLSEEKRAWFASFDVYPSKLFEGAKQRLTIALTAADVGAATVFSTGYNRWKSEGRDFLFAALGYARSYHDQDLNVIPKTGTELASAIIEKLGKKKQAAFRRDCDLLPEK